MRSLLRLRRKSPHGSSPHGSSPRGLSPRGLSPRGLSPRGLRWIRQLMACKEITKCPRITRLRIHVYLLSSGCVLIRIMSYGYATDAIKPKQNDNPLDTVSLIVWDVFRRSTEEGFLCSSWDGHVRYYQFLSKTNELLLAWAFYLQHPVLCCDIATDSVAIAGLATGDIFAISIVSNVAVHLGRHDAPIAAVFWSVQLNLLISFGFDQTMRFWNLAGPNFLEAQFRLPIKTHTASYDYPYLLIGGADSTIMILNLKHLPNLQIPRQYFTLSVEKFSKFNCSCINASKKYGSLGTIDGRSINFQFRELPAIRLSDIFVTRTQKKMSGSFSSHGQVNTITLGIYNNSVFEGIGGTEEFGVFNLSRRIKCKSFSTPSYSNLPITAARIHPTGKLIAYSSGSDWLKGLNELEKVKRPKIFIYKMKIDELNECVSLK